MLTSLKVYALSTARAGSKSVPNKNIMLINDKPLYLHNLLESMQTPQIKDTYISTDITQVIEDAPQYGYKVILRPPELCQDSSTHTDTIAHGLRAIEEAISDQLDILVVMLGNTINMDRHVTAQAIDMLIRDPELDSVITVIRANHFNPMRAYVDDGAGYITTYLPQQMIGEITSKKHISDKNAMGNILFQNGLWIIRRQAILDAAKSNKGLLPFPWFGNKIRYIEQDPRLQEIDDNYQIRLLED